MALTTQSDTSDGGRDSGQEAASGRAVVRQAGMLLALVTEAKT